MSGNTDYSWANCMVGPHLPARREGNKIYDRGGRLLAVTYATYATPTEIAVAMDDWVQIEIGAKP